MSDTFRKEYTPLSPEQKNAMMQVKEAAQALLTQMDLAVDPNERSERSRCMQVARTNLETAIMWAVKGITI